MTPRPESEESESPVVERLARRGHAVRAVTPMAGDVSSRRYLRVEVEGLPRPAVVALYPDDARETCRRYLVTSRLLADRGVRVAEVLDADCAAGWILLEDLGERTLYEHAERPWEELGPLFVCAVETIGRIRSLPTATVEELNPPLDRDLLRRELAQTRELFFAPLRLDRPEADPELAGALWPALEGLCERLAGDAPVPCHRDFGARNLMPLPGASPPSPAAIGVLDHQDLRLGPPAYDLASLLNDSLFPPPELERALLEQAGHGGEPGLRRYHEAAAQRTLKAIGSYAAFAGRGSGRHLPLIPPTLERAIAHLRRIPETAELSRRLEAACRPVLAGEGLDRLVADPG